MEPSPSSKFHSVHHLLDVLSTTVFILLVFLEISCPLCHSHPPTHVTDSLPLCAPAPPASICGFLDHLPSVFIFNPNSLTLHNLKIYRKKQSFLVVCLLLLAGDVEINPGPVQSILPTINLASFNIRSASSITDIHNKPEILKHLIHDHKIDAF